MKAESWRDPALPTRVKKIEERLGQLEDIPEYLASYFKEIDDAAQRGRPPDQFDITRAIPPDSFDIWDLLFRSEEILELLDRKSFDPFNNFVCPGCGSKHMVAVKVQCSTCKNEAWFSYFSKKT